MDSRCSKQHYRQQAIDNLDRTQQEEAELKKLAWQVVQCEEPPAKPAVTNATLKLDSSLTNLMTIYTNASYTFDIDTNYVALNLSYGTNTMLLEANSQSLISISTNGSVTIFNTNLDLVSSNFWKVLGQYFHEHYVRKD